MGRTSTAYWTTDARVPSERTATLTTESTVTARPIARMNHVSSR